MAEFTDELGSSEATNWLDAKPCFGVGPSLFWFDTSKANPQLNCIDAGIGYGKSGVGDVHIAKVEASGVIFAAMGYTDGTAGGEIDLRGAGRNVDAGKQGAAA